MSDPRPFRTLLILLTLGLAVSGVVDDASQEVAERSFTRALVTFAAARTLNSVISAAQGTEVALEPGGVGVILSVGEALDPINDLVERFSSVMLVAASSLGLQNILLGISRWWGMNLALGVIALAALVCLWSRPLANSRAAAIASSMFFALLFVRFVIPLLILGTSLVTDVFLEENLDRSTAALEAARDEIEEINETDVAERPVDESLLDRLGSMIGESLQSINASQRLEQLKDTASNAAEHIINLIVLFVLQTILLPLALFWVLLEITKGWIGRMAAGGTARTG
ncbi:MAG: hypothetical protein R3315_13440 [Woeseiaceae bacterium]|nr:hypothetical protein [Woeseiaceae bacterium]